MRAPRRPTVAIVVLIATQLVLLLAIVAPARAAEKITGAGSTWSQIAIDQWRADVARLGLEVAYTGVGSTSGRSLYKSGQVDFGVSEIPFQRNELPVGKPFQYLPIVAGGTSLMYNIPTAGGGRVTDLRLSSATIARIFAGDIQSWNDPRIRADYGKPLPDLKIKQVVRSDGSGTSAQFSAYLVDQQRSIACKLFKPCGQTSFWPQRTCPEGCVFQQGSDGVANYVASRSLGAGAITYVEYGYAKQRGFPVVSVRNRAGNYTQPTANNVAVALNHAKLNADRTQNLGAVYTAPEGNAYPISSYSYMIAPTSNIDPAKGNTLGRFMIYFACTGQRAAEPLGYSPLPPTLVGFVFDAVRDLKGAPAPPPLTGKACPNPTLTGDFKPTATDDPGPGGSLATPTGTTTESGPGAAGATDPSATASASGGPIYASNSPIPTLDAEALAKLQRAAEEDIAGMPVGSSAPMVFAGLLILALIFAPLFLRLRSGRAEDRAEEERPGKRS